MNPHLPTPKGGLHRALRVLSLLLLQHALVPIGTDAQARSRLPSNLENDSNEPESRPYLKVAGSLPLRFSAAPKPLSSLQAKITVPTEPVHAAAASSVEPAVSSTSTISTVDAKDPVGAPSAPAAPVTPSTNKPALSILPDDTHPSTRAEDFLPFFQFPAGGDVTVVVPASVAKPPAPGQMPVSSATYQQR